MRSVRVNPDATSYRVVRKIKKGTYPPYIIWDRSGPVFRTAMLPPNEVVGNDRRGTVIMQGLEYPSKRLMEWQTTNTPPGFSRAPYPYTY